MWPESPLSRRTHDGSTATMVNAQADALSRCGYELRLRDAMKAGGQSREKPANRRRSAPATIATPQEATHCGGFFIPAPEIIPGAEAGPATGKWLGELHLAHAQAHPAA